jgi:uncharacterized OB-fold protein
VQIIIGQAQLEKASQLRLGAKVRVIGQAQLEKASQLRLGAKVRGILRKRSRVHRRAVALYPRRVRAGLP